MKPSIPAAVAALLFATGCGSSSPCQRGNLAELSAARTFNQQSREAALVTRGFTDIDVPYQPAEPKHEPHEVFSEDGRSYIATPAYEENGPTPHLSFVVDRDGGTWLLDERPRVRRVVRENQCSCWGGGVPPMTRQLVYPLPENFKGKTVLEYEIDRIEESRWNLRSDGSSCPALP